MGSFIGIKAPLYMTPNKDMTNNQDNLDQIIFGSCEKLEAVTWKIRHALQKYIKLNNCPNT